MAMPKRQEYAWRGWGSNRPHPQGQGQLAGIDPHPEFQDLGNGSEHLTSRQFDKGEETLGVNQDEVARRMGAHLDNAFHAATERRHQENVAGEEAHRRSGAAGEFQPDNSLIHAEGQDWYDSASPGSHAHGVAQIAKKHDVPYHTVAAIKANTAQNIAPFQENKVTEQILDQTKAGVPPREMEGSTYGDVVKRAAMHAQPPDDVSPFERKSRYPRSIEETEDSSSIPYAMGHGYKKPGYYQSYVNPHDERTRPAMDRHMFRAGSNMTNDQIAKTQMSTSPPTKNTVTGLAGAAPAPAHRVLDTGMTKAATERGLAPPEAQTTIWHQVNRNTDRGMEGGGKDTPDLVNPGQFKLFGN